MGKRAPSDEGTYNPLDVSLAKSVIQGTGTIQDEGTYKEARLGEGETPRILHVPQDSPNHRIVELPREPVATVPEPIRPRSFGREKRVLLTANEEREVERLVHRIAEKLGTSLKLSHVLRACMTVLCHVEEEIVTHALEFRPLPRPGNGDAVGLAQFEHALAKLLSVALRNGPLVR